MNATIKTNNTVYELRDSEQIGKSYLTGGQFNNIEIDNPDIKENQPFRFCVTSNLNNGHFANRIMQTSPVSHIENQTPSKYMFKTRNNTYTLTSIENRNDIMSVSCNNYDNLEIYTPATTPNEGDALKFCFTDNPANGPFRNRIIQTSPVREKSHMQISQRKNPYELAAAYAKGELIYNINTSHSTYTLSPYSRNNGVMLLTGGVIERPLEVERPSSLPAEGDRLCLTYTNNALNQEYAGNSFKSSRVRDVSLSDGLYTYKLDDITSLYEEANNDVPLINAGKIQITQSFYDKADYGSLLQSKSADIADRAAELIGLPENEKHEIYFTPSISDGHEKSFEVIFNNFPTDSYDGYNAITQAISEELKAAYHYDIDIKTSRAKHLGKNELSMVRDAFISPDDSIGFTTKSYAANAHETLNENLISNNRQISNEFQL